MEDNGRYLAVHPTTYGLGFAVLERDLRLIDWGAYRARADKNQTSLRFLERLTRRFQPCAVLIETRERRERQRSVRIQHFIDSVRTSARQQGIVLKGISHRKVRRFFEAQGAMTKQEIALCIAELLPELLHYLPPRRKAWMPEHGHMGTFDAIALALTHFNADENIFHDRIQPRP